MKVYYLDPDIFPGTYNFKDEVVGTSGTDIDLIDSISANDSTYSGVITASEDGHRKVFEVNASGDNGKYVIYVHNFSSTQTSATVEFWIKFIDNGTGTYYIQIRDASNPLINLAYDNSDNKLSAFHAAINTSVSKSADTWIHIRATWDTGTDHQWIWVDGTALISDVAFYLSNVSDGATKIYFQTYGAAANDDLQLFLDAYGESWDTDYTIGENLYEKWHVSTQTLVTDIVTYPNPVQQNNAFTACSMVLGDFEGSLYATWKDLDQVKMRIEDDSSNVLWRGFLDNKRFDAKGLTLELASFGRQLEWKSFGSRERFNYILAKGIVDECHANSLITLKDDDGNPFTWTPGCWCGVDKDLGLMILDNTADYSEKTWDVSAINPVGSDGTGGNVASTQTFGDDNYYYATDTGFNVNMVINLDVDGAVIDSTTDFLKEIEIQFNWRMKINAVMYHTNTSTIKLQILKDTEWEPISNVTKTRLIGSTYTNWLTGVPTEEGENPIENGNDCQAVFTDTDVELQKYFNKTGDNYTSLKGLRFIVSGSRGSDSANYTRVYIDFIKVVVRHHAEDILPIMYPISWNEESFLQCLEVENWQLMGVTDDADRFYIGQNTRVILDDIAGESGVGIEIIGEDHESEGKIVPDGDTDTNEWDVQGGAGDHYTRLIDADDDTRLYADDTDIDKKEVFTFTSTGLHGRTVITKANVRMRTDGTTSAPDVKIRFGGVGDWSDPVTIVTGAIAWHDHLFEGLEIEEEWDLSGFNVQLDANTIPADKYIRVYEMEVILTMMGTDFNKYLSREFKGCHCIDPLKAVCKLEGADWVEDHVNEIIKVLKPADYEDSGVSLTVGGQTDWEFEDHCNAISQVHVWGNSANEVYANAKDPSINSLKSEQIIDERIMTNADAKEIADDYLALRKTKRPSIRIPLIGTYEDLVLGKTVNITFVRPTIAAADYPIRMIEREKWGVSGIRTTIHVGLGETIWDKQIIKGIKLASDLAHKAMTDKL